MRAGIQLVVSRDANLAILLGSLLRQTYQNWDLIIVYQNENVINNPLVLPLIERLKFEGHRVYFVLGSSELGVSALRNLALNADPNPIGCRIDDDSWCEPDYLELLLKVLLKEKAGAVGGLVPVISTEKLYKPIPKFNDVSGFLDIKDDNTFFYNCTKDSYYPTKHLRSSFMYYNKIAKEIGGFPEEYDEYAGFREETDFCFRMIIKGYKNFIVPNAVCWHFNSPFGGTRPKWVKHGKKAKWKAEEIFKKKFKENADVLSS